MVTGCSTGVEVDRRTGCFPEVVDDVDVEVWHSGCSISLKDEEN